MSLVDCHPKQDCIKVIVFFQTPKQRVTKWTKDYYKVGFKGMKQFGHTINLRIWRRNDALMLHSINTDYAINVVLTHGKTHLCK